VNELVRHDTSGVLRGANGDGLSPEASLVQGTDGNFYGTTFGGGASGYGAAFRLTPNGRVTVLHSFSYSDGAYPLSGLLLGTDGSFYGTTFGGGSDVCFVGCGTVFKIARNGAFTTLYAFGLSDGAKPHSGLAEGVDGYFYGTTAYGGANESCMVGSFVGCGTVFKITPAGKLTSLYNFAGGDGANPEAGLIQASDGNFYGTTDAGGANSFCNAGGAVGCGTVFKITPNGVLTTLHSFNGNDGANPLSALIQARDGRLYGTTFDGGLVGSGCGNNSCGTMFRIHHLARSPLCISSRARRTASMAGIQAPRSFRLRMGISTEQPQAADRLNSTAQSSR